MTKRDRVPESASTETPKARKIVRDKTPERGAPVVDAGDTALPTLANDLAEDAAVGLMAGSGIETFRAGAALNAGTSAAVAAPYAALGAGMLAAGGVHSALTQGAELLDTMRATGASWRDVGAALKDVFTTRQGWKDLGRGLLGSTADAVIPIVGPKVGDRIRDGMGDTRMDAKGGDTGPAGDEPIPEPGGTSASSPAGGGPRIVINPSTFRNEKDALCVAFNEAFRIVMEEMDFSPVSEPTEEQRRFFADTAYADDETQMRRTILARICTFDTSVKDPTDEQLQEAVEFLESIMEAGVPQNDWEQSAVQRIHDVISHVPMGQRNPAGAPAEENAPTEENASAEDLAVQGAVFAGNTDEDELNKGQTAQSASDVSSDAAAQTQTQTSDAPAQPAAQKSVDEILAESVKASEAAKQAVGELRTARSELRSAVGSFGKSLNEAAFDLGQYSLDPDGLGGGHDPVAYDEIDASNIGMFGFALKSRIEKGESLRDALAGAKKTWGNAEPFSREDAIKEMDEEANEALKSELGPASPGGSDRPPSPRPPLDVPLGTVSRAGDISTQYSNGGSTTVDHSSGRIVFAQPGQQGAAIDAASRHVARQFGTGFRGEVTVAPQARRQTPSPSVQIAGRVSRGMEQKGRDLAGNPIYGTRGPGWRDISGNWHEGRPGGTIGNSRQTTLGEQVTLGEQTTLGARLSRRLGKRRRLI